MNTTYHTIYVSKSFMDWRKRHIQVRRNIIMLVLSSIFVISAPILFLTFSTQANDVEHQPSYKYYKSIELSEGDTLWSVANEYIDYNYYKNTSEYIEEVMKMNALTSDKIFAGRHLIIPYYSTELIASEPIIN